MKAEIVTIGDELLSGETVDTNSSFLDAELEKRGWRVVRHTTVADDVEAIASVLCDAAQRTELVVVSGGLGPTGDDVTLEALARALGCRLVLHDATLTAIRERFARYGRVMTPNNERQAMVPEIGEVIGNGVGTAPAFAAPLGSSRVYLLPGVPSEVAWLVEHAIGPRLDRGEQGVHRRTLKTVGVGESRLEHTIRDVVRAHEPRVRFGYRALGVESHVKLASADRDALRAAEGDLRASLGELVFGADQDRLEAIVGAGLVRREETVSVAESCTGGLVSELLTEIPGASAYFAGSVVAYSNEAKVRLLGVSESTLAVHGAVSASVAEAMASSVRDRFRSTWGLAVTGIAGPSGGSADKPIGLAFVAVAGTGGVTSKRLQLPGDRRRIRESGALLALDQLRRRLD